MPDSIAGSAAQPITQILAAIAVETAAADIPAACLDPAKDLILDTIGVGLAASPRAIGKIVTDYAASSGATPVAGILGSPVRTSAEMAAHANGT